MTKAWAGRAVTDTARPYIANQLPAPCGRCSSTVHPMDEWVVGHIKSRAAYPELAWQPSNWRPEHKACSEGSKQEAVQEKARLQALRDAGVAPDAIEALMDAQEPSFPRYRGPAESPTLPVHTHEASAGPVEVPERLSWPVFVQAAPDWLKPYLVVPEDAAPPLAISPVHPDATGSYGPEMIEWAVANLPDVRRGFRWWQALLCVLQLQHDAAGNLLIRTVVESGPRRIGKSVRLRAMALWRTEHADLMGEQQLQMMCGKDLSIAREIHRRAWPWALARDGWDVRRGVGQEEVNKVDDVGEHRWLVRSLDSVYGFDVSAAAVDEAWAVPPAVVEEGLEPAMLERCNPQLTLTSTAHRKATSLMKRRISEALLGEDAETLLALWMVRPGSDFSDPEVWRAASPHWSADRERVERQKYEKAIAGEADPEFDDLDPVRGWASQYLCAWDLRERKTVRGEQVVAEEAWTALGVMTPEAVPDAAAVESWFSEGVSVALAWAVDDRAVVRAFEADDVAAAVELVKATGFKGSVAMGATIAEDPSARPMRKRSVKASMRSVVADLDGLMRDDVLRHDGGQHLTGQMLAVRTAPGADGPRLVSSERADAVKAAAWAATAARQRAGRSSRMVVPKAG